MSKSKREKHALVVSHDVVASLGDLSGDLLDLGGGSDLAGVHQVLHVLQGVVREALAAGLVVVDHEAEAVEVLGLDDHLALDVVGKQGAEQVVGGHAVLELLHELLVSFLTTDALDLALEVVKLDVTRVDVDSGSALLLGEGVDDLGDVEVLVPLLGGGHTVVNTLVLTNEFALEAAVTKLTHGGSISEGLDALYLLG